VPLYPVVRVEIRDDAAGGYSGLVDDRPVEAGPGWEDVRAAVVAAAARVAGQRLGQLKAVRVRGVAPDGGVWWMVVRADGRVEDITGSVTVGPPVPGRRGGAVVTPDGGRARVLARRRGPVTAVVTVLVLVALVVVVGAWSLSGHETTQRAAGPPLPGRRQVPVAVPAGYDPVATWAVRVGAAGMTAGVLAADTENVYTVGAAGDWLTAYAAGNGVRRWSAALDGQLTAGPSLTVIGDQPVVAVATTNTLYAFRADSGVSVGRWGLDPGEAVRFTATGPVAITPETNVARVIAGGELTARVMPAGGLPVAPGPGGSLISVTHGRVYWSVSDALAGPGRPLETPPSGRGVMVAGWTGDRLILAYPPSGAGKTGVRLVAYRAPLVREGAWRREWTTRLVRAAPDPGMGGQLPLVTGPAGQWGVYNEVSVRLGDGGVTALGVAWSTVTVGDGVAFGAGPGRILSAGPGGITGTVATESASGTVTAPQAVTTGGWAFVVFASVPDTWLYAVRPSAAPAPAVTPAQRPVPKPSRSRRGQRDAARRTRPGRAGARGRR
jgi:hypothetical protein